MANGLVKVGGALTGFTRLSKGLAAVLVTGFIVSQLFPPAVDYLALVPGKTIPFGWNILTAGYLESTFLGLIVTIIGLLLFGKLLEPIWGSKEFLKFIVFVNLFTSLSTFVLAILLYYITRGDNYLYVPISGFNGVLAGFLVAVKQIMPDQELTAFFFLKLKAKWLPSILVTFSSIIGFLTSDTILYLPFIIFGTYVSWLYLRYFQAKPENSFKGDPSDEFSFSTFFPDFLGPVINPVAIICEKTFCGRRGQNEDNEGHGYILGGGPLPGSDPVEASRRRERGARALEERLTAASASGGESNTLKVTKVGHSENLASLENV
ncbi:hypothetical protein O6H91_06G104100 [Diphasiastrum complanatum]|uniref:Uncharacterized protein n=1 Tax=Diphasiastrum complanatum TaxID=34168 RepID=A0ACC2DHD8_DIPCM|nr:hypothetical protein O6H91_06G104100 [Diphasiastrum complanatum]